LAGNRKEWLILWTEQAEQRLTAPASNKFKSGDAVQSRRLRDAAAIALVNSRMTARTGI
jgi:hypothetical protein